MKIDSDRLLEWISDQEAGLRSTLADLESETAAAQRVEGGLTILRRIRANLPSMMQRTPVKEIKTEVKAKVRRRDPMTSFQAALSQTPDKTRALYMAIYSVLERKPMTDEALLALFQSHGKAVTPSGVRSRRAELVEAGWVRDSGEKGTTASGHPSIIWEVVPSAF